MLVKEKTHHFNFDYRAMFFPFIKIWVMSFDFLLLLVELKFSCGSDA